MTINTWDQVLAILESHEEGEILRLPKFWLPHPADIGANRSVGMPVGQTADFRLRIEGHRGLHIRDFGSHYEAHIDRVDPSYDAVGHFRHDAPSAFVFGSTAVGALLGALLGGNKGASLAGAGIGALIGMAALPIRMKKKRYERPAAKCRPRLESPRGLSRLADS